jgi:hypothetical protein
MRYFPIIRPTPSYMRSPAIAACIAESRRPSEEEIRTVVARIWREGLAQRCGNASQFGARRLAFRAAMAALTGG